MYKPNNFSFSMPKPYHTVNMPKTFPEDIQCIIKAKDPQVGSLYISNVQAASNPATLKKLKIGAILTCAKGYQQKHPKSLIPYYKYIEAVDHEQCKISVHFEDAVDFIDSSLKKTNLLVHCIAGVSRSVSMVIAYFIRQHNMMYDEAYKLVKSKRKIIHPNDGFIAQLKQFQKKIKSKGNKINKAPIRSDRSQGQRSIQKQLTFSKYQDNFYLDKDNFIQTKSKEIKPSKSTPKDNNYLQKYTSNQLQKYSYTSKNYKNYGVPVSLQQIPNNNSQIELQKDKALTPKSKNIDYKKSQYTYQLPRSTTNYYTPAKQVPRESYNHTITYTKYRDDPLSTKLQSKIQRPSTTSHLAKSYTRKQTNITYEGQTQQKRQQFFDSMNSQLNDKIQKIRQKYQVQRQKLYTKYQTIKTPDNQYKTPDNKTYENRYTSKYSHINQNKYTPPQILKYSDRIQNRYEKTYKDYNRQYKTGYQNILSKTDTKDYSLPRKSYEQYQPRNYKNHLNEQQNYSKMFQRTATSNNLNNLNNYPSSKYNDYPSSAYKHLEMNRLNGYLNTKAHGVSFYDQSYQYKTSTKRFY